MKHKRTFRVKQKKELPEETFDYEKELSNHRRKRFFAIGVIALACVVAALGFFIYYQNKVYEKYSVQNTLAIDNSASSTFYAFGDGVLRVSPDGFAYINSKGTVWDAAYEMRNMTTDVCEDYVAVGEIEGSDIYISNTTGTVGTVQTMYPLVKVSVSASGVVAALSDDGSANYIEIMSADGTNLVTGKTVLEGNGYPLDLSISPDGTRLIVSYLYVSGGVMQSKVVFYNFSEVGKNEVDRMVGGFNQYEDMIVPEVEFVSDDTAIAIADSLISIYSIRQKPSLIAEFEVTEEIVKVFYNKSYIGVITETDSADAPYELKIYSTEGKEVRTEALSTLYDTCSFTKNGLVMCQGKKCRVETVKGNVKFDQELEQELLDVIPSGGAYEFIFVFGDKIEKVHLK